MSNKPHHCARCDAVVPFEPERESAFAVYWKCPRCRERSLVVSPLGPWLAPAPGACLQCGHEAAAESQACPSCGIIVADVLAADEAGRTDGALLGAAREEFARGTCRRGLTLVNHVLRRNPHSAEAWSIKEQFFAHLGFRRAQEAVRREAARLAGAGGGAGSGRPGGKRWWEFWK